MDYAERIARKNAAFAKMTPRQRRVEIAKDVIEQIAVEKIRGAKGTYFDLVISELPGDLQRYNVVRKNYEWCLLPTQEIASRNDLPCHVCAKGAFFLGALRKFDHFGGQGDHMDEGYLEDLFGAEEADLIEGVFEGWDHRVPRFQKQRLRDFYRKYPDDTDRIAAIAHNIVRNRGRFVLHRDTSKDWVPA